MKIGRGIATAIAAHNVLATGVHGVGVSIVATIANIATHAALVATHGVAGTIAGLADIATHAALVATHGVATIAGLADIATHAGDADAHHDSMKLTEAQFREYPGTGTSTNPQKINDIDVGSFNTSLLNEYTQVLFGMLRYVKEVRLYGSHVMTGDGSYAIEFYVAGEWILNTYAIPVVTVNDWGSWISLTTPGLTGGIRLCTNVQDSYGDNQIREAEMRG